MGVWMHKQILKDENSKLKHWRDHHSYSWICCCSAIQSCPTLCNPIGCSTPGFPVLHCLLELAQTHVHWFGDAIQPSHPLSSPSSPTPSKWSLQNPETLSKSLCSETWVQKELWFSSGLRSFFFPTHQSIQDLSSPTRDWTHVLCSWAWSLNHLKCCWTAREVPQGLNNLPKFIDLEWSLENYVPSGTGHTSVCVLGLPWGA